MSAAPAGLILAFPESLEPARRLALAAGWDCQEVLLHDFPDGESLVRLPPALPPEVVFYRSLDWPNAKLVELALAARTARELGAVRGPASLAVLVTHALFVEDALERLAAAGVDSVWSTDSIPHQSNRLALAPLLAQALPTPVAAR